MQADVFIDPAFWKALGKKRDGPFRTTISNIGRSRSNGRKVLKKFWHRFIDHLAEGKDAESFFQAIRN